MTSQDTTANKYKLNYIMQRNWSLYVLPVLRDHCNFGSVCFAR